MGWMIKAFLNNQPKINNPGCDDVGWIQIAHGGSVADTYG
jgi:hypothetical protein